ncbi:MAG: Ser-Thr-rich GPI-anchored membrane family protein [Candidatus Aminicenantes bacterium]|jgi:hypothetical protein
MEYRTKEKNNEIKPILKFFIMIVFISGLFVSFIWGDYKSTYYPSPNLITVDLEGDIVAYLDCERVTLDYPELVSRPDVNMGRDNKGNIWAGIGGVPKSPMKRLFRSRDGGRTWTSIQLSPTLGRYLIAFAVLNNNHLILATHTGPTDPQIYQSSDPGSSWLYITGLSPDPYRYIGEGFLSFTPLANNDILFPIARWNSDDPFTDGIFGGVFVSKDGGNTFPKVYPTFKFCIETHILELQSGDLLAAFRYQRFRLPGDTDEAILAQGGNIDPDHMFAFKNVFLGDSHDSGKTWHNLRPLRDSNDRPLIRYGQCHGQLVQVPDGRVVLVYGNRYPYEQRDVRACTSWDGGQTWDPATYHLSFGAGGPASVVLEDGTIVTVTGSLPNGPSGPIAPPTARAIRWKLPPDSDADGIPDQWDNCPNHANSSQSDIDGDNIGDPCDDNDIEIIAPTSLSGWPPGTRQIIRWEPNKWISKIKIGLYKGNSPAKTLASSLDNSGSYTWYIPDNITAGSNYKIRITDTANPSIYGQSDWFSITRDTIYLNKTQLTFGAVVNGPSTGPQRVIMGNGDNGTLNWSISTSAAWLNCSPKSGTHSAAIIVSTDRTGLSAGTYNGIITISAPNASNSPQMISVTLNIYKPGASSQPFGTFETPVQGSTVRSSIPVTGWVLDDIEVKSVKIYNGATYLGDAVFVEGARPDVRQVYPGYPRNYQAGWGYMLLTNFLPNGGNGTYTLYAKASDAEGNQVTLGSKRITIDNMHAVKPFGAIDTPGQGGTASGRSFINWGWVLTPQPNHIPLDGSTINVYIDGIRLGHPAYNIYRTDIAALFPGYANSNRAAGYFYLDTTAYENGVHTIQWTVKDSNGNSDGIGSRYFSIENTSGSSTAKSKSQAVNYSISQLTTLPIDFSGPLKVKHGFNENIEPMTIHPDKQGISKILIRELERVEIQLAGDASEIYGYMLSGSRFYPLPIGSTLRAKRGTFCWLPGPGFTGEYRFLFIVRDEDGNMTRQMVTVNIVPKFPGIG